ncbi:MAG: homoserine O-acetyltransferase [Bacteroidetes bacterium]|nr:MAG: homoserine O-acetyltransferase [Bacteroidota bacterium]
MSLQYLHIEHPFVLESGAVLPRLTLAFTTHGQLNARKDNVVWVCHALTGNADPTEWWGGLVGPGQVIDPARHFIVCANMLGSCYGSSGPHDLNPATGRAYGLDFPLVTTRDLARSHALLANYLQLDRIQLSIGGSMGGQQVLEWALLEPERLERICVLASNAQHTPWGIAFNESQRMALRTDPTFGTNAPDAGRAGLETARAIAMLSYRHPLTYNGSQAETDDRKLEDFRAASYQRYQGFKLWKRFTPESYWSLSRTMDTHNIGRGRGGLKSALGRIQAKSLIIGIDTDMLFTIAEQSFLAEHIPDARFEIISSEFGHDGFLTETRSVSALLRSFLTDSFNGRKPSPLLKQNMGLKLGAAIPGSESF